METETSNPQSAAGLPAICTIVAQDLRNAGELILGGAAAQILADYFRETRTSPTTAGFVFGNLFGLSQVKEIIFRIDKYNANVVNIDDRIDGIRIYEGLSQRSYLPPPRDKEWLLDFILMPVLHTGDDLYKVVPLVDPDIILSHGRPCPNECGTSFV